MNISLCLGQVISERRRYLGMNQEELSAKAGIHRAYLSDVERGLRNITLAVFDRIAAALQSTMADLMRQAEISRETSTNTQRLTSNRQDLRVLVEELTAQLDELVIHAEEFNANRQESARQLARVRQSSDSIKSRAKSQRKLVAENVRRAEAVEAEEQSLTNRESHTKHREQFLEKRESPDEPKVQRKRKKNT